MDAEETPASLEYYAEALSDGVQAAIPTWVVNSVERLMTAWAGHVPVEVAVAAELAAAEARDEGGSAVRALLRTDIDEQRTTPLAILRHAVRFPTAVLRRAGVPAVERDRFAESAFPDDIYDLTPTSLADIDPALAELGISWGSGQGLRAQTAPPLRTHAPQPHLLTTYGHAMKAAPSKSPGVSRFTPDAGVEVDTPCHRQAEA